MFFIKETCGPNATYEYSPYSSLTGSQASISSARDDLSTIQEQNSEPSEPEEEPPASLCSFFAWTYIKIVFTTCFRPRENNGRKVLILLISCMLVSGFQGDQWHTVGWLRRVNIV